MTTAKLRLVTTSRKLDTTQYRTLPAGIHLPSGRYVAPGATIVTQSAANSLASVHQSRNYKAGRSSLFAIKPLSVTRKRSEPVINFKPAQSASNVMVKRFA